MKAQFGFELGEVRQCGTFPKLAFIKLGAGFLHANFERGVGPGIERHWFAIRHLVLPHPTAVRLSNFDTDSGKLFSPTPNEVFDFAKAFEVLVVHSVLADFESAIRFDE